MKVSHFMFTCSHLVFTFYLLHFRPFNVNLYLVFTYVHIDNLVIYIFENMLVPSVLC